MAKPSRAEECTDDSTPATSAEEEVAKDLGFDKEDEEEIEAVARAADDSNDEDGSNGSGPMEDENEDDNAIAKLEKFRLKEMERLKKQKLQDILDAQNAAIEADMNNKGKGRLKFLLQQTELFSHFAQGDRSVSQKKAKGRIDSGGMG